MSLEITGLVKQVHAAETKGTFTFRKLWLILEAGSQYPQLVEVQAAQAKVVLFDNLNEGDEVTCHLNVRGREHDGKVYNTLQAWKVEKKSTVQHTPAVPAQQNIIPQQTDNLPF